MKDENYKKAWESLQHSLKEDTVRARIGRNNAVSDGDMGAAISRDAALRTLNNVRHQMAHLQSSLEAQE